MSSNTEMDRLFDLLQEQGRALSEQGKTLAKIEQSQEDTRARLFGSQNEPGAIPFLYKETARHSKQINFWKGAIAVLSFVWTAAVAYATTVLKRHP